MLLRLLVRCSRGRTTAWGAAVVAVAMVAPIAIARGAPPKKPPPAGSTSATVAPPPPPLTPEEAEAKHHFELGLKLYAEKAYDGALVEFEQSYQLNPRPSALRNVAQCHRDLKHFAAAHDTYEKLLAAHGAQLTAKEKDTIGRAMKDLELFTGQIDLTSNEAGASVQLDAHSIGTTPLDKPFRVDPGVHKVRVFKSGFEPFEKEVTILAEKTQTLQVTLIKEVTTGRLTVREEGGKEVHVFLDGVDVGRAPWSGDLAPGEHSVEIKGQGVGAPKRTVVVVAKGTIDVAFEATALLGHLRVESLGNLGEIAIDGTKVGDGAWEGDLSPGSHEVDVVAVGYQPYKHLVAVTKGQTVVEAVTLVAIPKPPPIAPPVDVFRGLYAKFNVIGAFPLTSSADLSSTCSTNGAATCNNNGLDAFVGTKLHVGYSWDIFSLELVSGFLFHLSHKIDRNFPGKSTAVVTPGSTVDDDVQRTESHRFSGFSVFVGPGARLTSKDDAVRFTGGLAVGGAYRSLSYKRETLSDVWSPSDVHAFAPAMMIDAGLLLGNTPGTKFTLGVVAWIELGPTMTTDDGGARPGKTSAGIPVSIPSPPTTLSSGVQFYLGPTLGLQFGR